MSTERTITPELVAQIVSNPTAYGFDWISGKVAKNEMDLGYVPLVAHKDLNLLRQHFGDQMVLGAMDGTSRHVTNQRIARDMKFDNRKTSDLEIKTAIVENMLGKKATRKTVVVEKIVEKRIYCAFDDTEFESKEERDEYNKLLKQSEASE